MALIEIKVPDIGSTDPVAVIELLVKVGDTVAVEQSLITVESDKASMEIPSSHAGVVQAMRVQLGDQVSEGSLILVLEAEGAGAGAGDVASNQPPAQAAPAVAAIKTEVVAAPAAPAVSVMAPAATAPAHNPTLAPVSGLAHASPSVRKFARELGVPLTEVQGSGRKGRITQEDVQAFTQSVMAGAVKTAAQQAVQPKTAAPAAGSGSGAGLDLLPWPKVDFAKFGAVERKDLSRIKKISGANLHRNWVMIPHVTVNDEADMTDLETFRQQLNKEWEREGLKLSPLAFVIKASVVALKAFPEFNSSLDGENLVLKKFYNIGFAADTPNGLVVPVIKDADKKGLKQILQELTELSKKAREGKLKPNEMQGATFTISSLGGIGGTSFTPIVNAPEVAILGVCKSQMKPVWNGKEFQPRLMCPLSLSFDHRVIDGAAGMRFTVYIANLLKDFRRITL